MVHLFRIPIRVKGKLSAKIQNLIVNRMSTPLSETAIRFSKFAPSHEKFNFEVEISSDFCAIYPSKSTKHLR